MTDYTVTRRADGRVLWALCALLFSAGFLLLIGVGAVFMVAALAWGGYLAYRRTPGAIYGLPVLGVVAAGLLSAWAIF